MKAAVYRNYGSPEVLHVTEIEKPVPDAGEVLVRIHATTVTAGDVRMRSFTVPAWQWLFARLYLGLFRPKRPVLGMECAGRIEAVGRDVKNFTVGDRVFASTFGVNFGGYAEYKCFPGDGIITTMPAAGSYSDASTLPIGAAAALRFLRKGKIETRRNVLIYGASGSVGSFAVQIAKHFGARVTGVCGPSNVQLVQALGADAVIDYSTGRFIRDGVPYDLMFDAVGKIRSADCKAALESNGMFLSVLDDSGKESVADLEFLKSLYELGHLRPFIEKTYTMEQIVEAHRHVETGHKKGNVVVLVSQEQEEQ